MKTMTCRRVYPKGSLLMSAATFLVAAPAIAQNTGRELITERGRQSQSVATETISNGQSEPSLGRDAVLRLADSETTRLTDAAAGERVSEGSKRSLGLEEIVVTAQRRKERLQDVPISITAITADDIDRRGLVGGADYLRGMPGANQIEAAPSQSIVIRGIETQHAYQGGTGGQATGTYFGESPTTGSAGFISSSVDIKLVDIERIEVLRGPQGTTFGSGSLGGVVRAIPVAPKLEGFEGKMSVGYSVTSGAADDNYNVEAMGNIPLVRDKLALRATAYQYQDSGFYRNRAHSNAAFQSAVVIPQGSQAFATDSNEVGSYYVLGGRVAALWQPTDDLKLTLSYLKQQTETDGIPLATSDSYEQTVLRVAPEHVRRGQTLGLIDTDLDLANAVLEYNLSWADLLASYSYIEGGTDYMRPMTSVGLNQARSQANESPHLGRVGELRLATKLEGPWNFLAGVYAENVKDWYDFDSIWFGDLASSPYLSRGVGRYLGDSHTVNKQTQKAVFGEVSWEFLPNLTFTGGARFSEYEVNQQAKGTGIHFADAVGSVEDSKTTPKANLSYKPSADTLLYAGWAQSFRIGRPVLSSIPVAQCDVDSNGLYDGTEIRVGSLNQLNSDDVDSYELGGKFAFMEGRLRTDAALFYMNWTGIPVLAVLPCRISYSVNAGEARSEGIEFQANYQITDMLRLDFGGSWTRARLTKDVPLQGWSNGDELPGSPEASANLGLQYEFAIGSHKAFVRADSIYVGPFHSLIGQELEAGDYVKVDASARISVGNLSIDLFARNVTNEDAFTYHSPFALPGLSEFFGYQLRPRTFGFQLGYDF
jgi:iron complex outermembrane recepter protein